MEILQFQRWRMLRGLLIASCAAATVGVVGYFALGWSVRSAALAAHRQAEQALRRRDNAGVREALKWLLWFEPQDERALLIAGVSLNADRRFPEAIALLERIPESSRVYEEGGVSLAASLIEDGQLERAEDVLKQVLARFPRSADAHGRLVRLFLKQLRQRDAIELLLARWRQDPNDVSVLPDLLELAVKRVTAHDRVGFLERSDEKHPRQAAVVLALAQAYALMGQTEPAKVRYQSVLQIRPLDPLSRVLAAEFSLDSGDIKSATLLLDEGSDTVSNAFHTFDDDRHWMVRSRIAEQSGDLATASANIEKALALRPNDETYLLAKAALLRQLRRNPEAAVAAGQASRMAEARKQLLLLWEKLDRNRPAPQLCLKIAEGLAALGEPEQAAGWRRVSQVAASRSSLEDGRNPSLPHAALLRP